MKEDKGIEITSIDDLTFKVEKSHKFIVKTKEFKNYLKTLTEKQIEKINKNFFQVELTSGFLKLIKK